MVKLARELAWSKTQLLRIVTPVIVNLIFIADLYNLLFPFPYLTSRPCLNNLEGAFIMFRAGELAEYQTKIR